MSNKPAQEQVTRPATPEEIAALDAMRPIFIVGCGHSGTTLLTAIMDTHPNIHAFPGESGIFRRNRPRLHLGAFVDVAEAAKALGKSRLLEKTPRHVHHIGSIFSILPSARVIFMIRDGRDVTVSLERRVGDRQHGINRWIDDNTAGLAAVEAHPGRIHILRYEDLVADPAATLAAACDFVGEPFDPGMLNYHEVDREWFGQPAVPKPSVLAHNSRRSEQIRTPLFDGRGEWRKLPEEAQAELNEVLKPMLVRLGYVEAA